MRIGDSLLGARVTASAALAGGSIADVARVALEDGRTVVVKTARGHDQQSFQIEAEMLRYLGAHSELPVPDVLAVAPERLVLSYIPHSGRLTEAGERDAGRHIARLHAVTDEHYGFDADCLIGPLPQPAGRASDWPVFFGDHRLLYMARLAREAGQITAREYDRIAAFGEGLGGLLPQKPHASLLHGDLWGGNILGDGDRTAGFVDPAIYYGDGEVDLAFITLFSSVGPAFFDGYREVRRIDQGFFELRRDIYNLWPLLVHVRLFGRSYWSGVARVLARYGC